MYTLDVQKIKQGFSMAKFLSKVSKGKIKKPQLVLIYGVDSVGKSTFGAQSPNPIFLGAEEGTNNLDVSRFPSVDRWVDIDAQLNELLTEKHDYKSLVVDSLDWLEPLLHQHICDRYGSKSIDHAAGGYGKGYTEAVLEWIKFNKLLTKLRDERKMNIILIAHSQITKFSDPTTQTEYDRYSLKLYKKSADLFREFVDSVLFANFEVSSFKDGSKTRVDGDGIRILNTERRPGFDAKNRFSLPLTIPLSWDDYVKACELSEVTPEFLVQSIDGLMENITDDELRKKIVQTVAKAGNSVVDLEAIKNRILVIIEEQQGA